MRLLLSEESGVCAIMVMRHTSTGRKFRTSYVFKGKVSASILIRKRERVANNYAKIQGFSSSRAY
jgi:hypothetical protein